MTQDDWGVFPELTIEENAEIHKARKAGYCDRDFGLTIEEQAQNTLAGAREYLKQHSAPALTDEALHGGT